MYKKHCREQERRSSDTAGTVGLACRAQRAAIAGVEVEVVAVWDGVAKTLKGGADCRWLGGAF